MYAMDSLVVRIPIYSKTIPTMQSYNKFENK